MAGELSALPGLSEFAVTFAVDGFGQSVEIGFKLLDPASFLADPRNDAASSSPRENWAPMMSADPAYLDTMFDAVLTAHGSVENYARTALGLSTSDIERLRSRLCE